MLSLQGYVMHSSLHHTNILIFEIWSEEPFPDGIKNLLFRPKPSSRQFLLVGNNLFVVNSGETEHLLTLSNTLKNISA